MELQKPIEIPSRRFGKYTVRSRLGSGGMADVFRAEAIDELGDELNVALKLMREHVSEEAFADEADLMGLLSHPNLVRRLEVGQAFGRPFIAMEYLIGGDLRCLMEAHRQQRRGIPTAMGVHIVLEALKALAYFHRAKTRTGVPLGLVHGDVNPSNIFFAGDGMVKLGDFGVAKSHATNIGPGDGIAAGKLHYLSPEQCRGERLSPASDLFAVGVMLHELVVGYHPFAPHSRDPKEVTSAILAARLSLPDFVEKPLVQVLHKAITSEPRNRYRTAGEFAGDLLRYTLDAGMGLSQRDVQHWLESILGLVM